MESITRINHIGIRVSNFLSSRNFYEKLGFQWVIGPGGLGPVAIMEHPAGININFIVNADQEEIRNILMDIPEKYAGYTHMALEVTDAETLIANLEDNNIPLSGGPMNHPTGTSFFIRDPDKNVIEFIEYKGIKNLQ